MTQAQQIRRKDVQSLLHRVSVRPDHRYSRRFPDEHACNVTIHLEDGRTFGTEKRDYEGFTTRPATWDAVRRKFDRLTTPRTSSRLREDIVHALPGRRPDGPDRHGARP